MHISVKQRRYFHIILRAPSKSVDCKRGFSRAAKSPSGLRRSFRMTPSCADRSRQVVLILRLQRTLRWYPNSPTHHHEKTARIQGNQTTLRIESFRRCGIVWECIPSFHCFRRPRRAWFQRSKIQKTGTLTIQSVCPPRLLLFVAFVILHLK